MKSWLGWVSIVLAFGVGALIRLLLFPLMVLGFMKFATFEIISIPLSAVATTLGVIGVMRRKNRVLSFVGATIGIVLLLWLIVLNFVTIKNLSFLYSRTRKDVGYGSYQD